MPYHPFRARAPWRMLLGLALLALLVAACAPATPPPTQAAPTEQAAPGEQAAPAQPVDVVETAAPVEQAAPTQPPAAAAPTEAPAQPVISNEFTPSDPAQVSLAAGRPQLVELFAFW